MGKTGTLQGEDGDPTWGRRMGIPGMEDGDPRGEDGTPHGEKKSSLVKVINGLVVGSSYLSPLVSDTQFLYSIVSQGSVQGPPSPLNTPHSLPHSHQSPLGFLPLY